MGEADVVAVPRRRSRAEGEQLLCEYEASGLSREEFCQRKGLSLATLGRYRKRQADGKATPGSRWLAVEVSDGGAVPPREANSGLVVAVGSGRRIEVGRGFDTQTLIQLLGALERI